MEMRQLRYFSVLADELHFHRAAERLRVAQPALSRQIRQLEEELQVVLFKRSRRRVEITEGGKLFLERTRRVLNDLERAASDARNIQSGIPGSLTFAFVQSASYVLVPTILRIFRRRFPDVELHLVDLSTAQQLEALSRDQVDVALLHPWRQVSGIAFSPLFTESFVVACPESHPLAHKRNISLKAFAGDRFIMHARGLGPTVSGMFEVTSQLLRNAGVEPKVAAEVPAQMHAALGLVNAGFGVALVPSSLMQLQLQGVSYATIRENKPANEVSLAWRRDNANPLREPFIEAAMQGAHKLRGRSRARTGSGSP